MSRLRWLARQVRLIPGSVRDAVWHFRLTRDSLLLVGGFGGFLHELFIPVSTTTERPAILALCGLMMGLGVANQAIDRIKSNGRSDDA